MKKREVWKVLVLFLLMGLAGCGENARESAGGKIESNNMEHDKEREELTLWSYYETTAQKNGLDKLVREYNASQDKYEVSWEYVPMADFIRNLTFSQSGNNLPDLVLVDNPDIGSLIKIGLLADITDGLKGNVTVEEFRFTGNRNKIRESSTAAALGLMRRCVLEYYSKVTFGNGTGEQGRK